MSVSVIFQLFCASFLLLGNAPVFAQSNVTPFCTVCQCSQSNPSEKVIVDCTQSAQKNDKNVIQIKQLLFENSTYMKTDGTLYGIKTLNLSSVPLEELKGVFPNSTLEILDLSNANLQDIQNEAFKNLDNLKELYLGHNDRLTIRPEMFQGQYMEGQYYPLKTLSILHLNDNNISKINVSDFEFFEKTLEALSLSRNPLTEVDAGLQHALLNIINLRELDLSYTNISKLPQHFLFTPEKITKLNLQGNRIADLNELSLGEAHALQVLILNENPIRNITLMPKIKTLKVLHLCNMPNLTSVANKSFGLLENLEELHMAFNPHLTEVAQEAFEYYESKMKILEMVPLKKLYINNNNLENLFLNVPWQELEDFNISSNPFVCACQNQHILDVILPLQRQNNIADYSLICSKPVEMEGLRMYDLSLDDYEMRCSDLYDRRPELDGPLLMGFFFGSLFILLAVVVAFHAYRYNWYGVFDSSPASFSRQFYRRTRSMDEEF